MSERGIGRRSFLEQVAGGGLLAGCVAMVAGPAAAQRRRRRPEDAPLPQRRMAVDADAADPARPMPGAPAARAECSDSDGGRHGDPVGRGRHCGGPLTTGCTDRDAGAGGDPVGRGRHCGSAGPRERWVLCPGHPRCIR